MRNQFEAKTIQSCRMEAFPEVPIPRAGKFGPRKRRCRTGYTLVAAPTVDPAAQRAQHQAIPSLLLTQGG